MESVIKNQYAPPDFANHQQSTTEGHSIDGKMLADEMSHYIHYKCKVWCDTRRLYTP